MAYRDEVLADSPVAYWRHEETSGTALACEINSSNDATVSGSPVLNTSGPTAELGSAVDFDGSDDEALSGFIGISGDNPRTVEFWVRTTDGAAGSAKHIVEWGSSGDGQRYTIRPETSNGNLRIEVQGGFVVFDINIADGEWHYVVVALPNIASPNVTDHVAYVDAVQANIVDSGSQSVNTGTDVNVGWGYSSLLVSGEGRHIDAELDELAIYDFELSSDRIKVHYNYGIEEEYAAEVLADSPTAYWRLGESSGTTAVDETANNNDGTYVGSPTLGASGAIATSSDTAVDFDGVDDYVNVGLLPAQASDFTFEFWIKTTTTAIEATGVIGRNTFQIFFNRDASGSNVPGTTQFMVRDSSGGGDFTRFTITQDIYDGAWHHVVITVGTDPSLESAFAVYVDKVSVGLTFEQSTCGTNWGIQDADMLVAARNNAGADSFLTAMLDEVAMYYQELTATRVEVHYDAAQSSPSIITFDPHAVLLKHRPLFEGVFSPHTVVLNHFKAVPLQPHTVNLLHRGNVLKGDDSEQGQAKALRSLLGYGWGIPDPPGSANEKIETPRESWPIHRFHEAERLLRQEGVEEPTAQALGDALRRLGEDIHLDVKENLQRYEWHANAHTHSALGGAGTTPIGPADSVFLCGGSLRRYRADNGNLVWSVGSGLDRMALDQVNERIFTVNSPGANEVKQIETYDFGGSLIWKSDPFVDAPKVDTREVAICLSRDRQSLYMVYLRTDGEIGVSKVKAQDGSQETVGSSTGFTTTFLTNGLVIDTINDFLYIIDGGGAEDGRVIKLSLGDGSFKWMTALGYSGGSSSHAICVTETLVWVMRGNKIFALDPSDGSTVGSSLFRTDDYYGIVATKIWKDFQNTNSVYVTTGERFQPNAWLHRVYLVGDVVKVDKSLYAFDESNVDILARDAEGSFYIGGGSDTTDEEDRQQIYKLNPDLSLAWQQDGNATEILTDQGRSVHWG